MEHTIYRISAYAEENLRVAHQNLTQLNDVQGRISYLKQSIARIYRNNMIHDLNTQTYNYDLIKLENEIKDRESMFGSIKNSFVSNISFAFSYASEILLIEISNDSNDIHKSSSIFREISSLLISVDIQMNIPLYSLIPKLVEVETKLLLNDNKVRFMNLRIFIRDIKSKIQ
jgi:hypothetical protein